MKKRNMFSLFAATALAVGFTACNSNNENNTGSASTDTAAATTNTAVTTHTSSKNYAAMADSFKTNSDAGNYLNPNTGVPYKITVNSAGTLVDENGNPVRHYVDKRTWWVYDANTGDTVGSAKMQNGRLRYNDNNGRWITYEERYRVVMDSANGNRSSDTTNSMNNTGSMDSSHSMNNTMQKNSHHTGTNSSTVNPKDKNTKERG